MADWGILHDSVLLGQIRSRLSWVRSLRVGPVPGELGGVSSVIFGYFRQPWAGSNEFVHLRLSPSTLGQLRLNPGSAQARSGTFSSIRTYSGKLGFTRPFPPDSFGFSCFDRSRGAGETTVSSWCHVGSWLVTLPSLGTRAVAGWETLLAGGGYPNLPSERETRRWRPLVPLSPIPKGYGKACLETEKLRQGTVVGCCVRIRVPDAEG